MRSGGRWEWVVWRSLVNTAYGPPKGGRERGWGDMGSLLVVFLGAGERYVQKSFVAGMQEYGWARCRFHDTARGGWLLGAEKIGPTGGPGVWLVALCLWVSGVLIRWVWEPVVAA